MADVVTNEARDRVLASLLSHRANQEQHQHHQVVPIQRAQRHWAPWAFWRPRARSAPTLLDEGDLDVGSSERAFMNMLQANANGSSGSVQREHRSVRVNLGYPLTRHMPAREHGAGHELASLLRPRPVDETAESSESAHGGRGCANGCTWCFACDGSNCTSAIFVLSIALLYAMFFALLLSVYYQVTGNLATARAQMLPYLGDLANHTLSTMTHADQTALLAEGVLGDGKLLSGSAVPAMMRALNESQAIVARLERLAAHPTIRLSLGDGSGAT